MFTFRWISLFVVSSNKSTKKKQISLFDRSVGTTRDKVKGHNVHVYCPINSGYFATNKKGVGVEKGR